MEKIKFETPIFIRVEGENGDWEIDAHEVIHTLDDMKFEINCIDDLKTKIEDKDLKYKIHEIDLDIDDDGNLITIVETYEKLNNEDKQKLMEFLKDQYLNDVGEYLSNECYTTFDDDEDDWEDEAYMVINNIGEFALKEI